MNHAILVLSLVGFHANTDACKHPGIFSAGAVAKAYRDNQAYATEYFEGDKVIQISGRMLVLKKLTEKDRQKLRLEIEDSVDVYMLRISADGKPPKAVGLTFIFADEDACKLAQLFVGQYLSVKGKFHSIEVDPAQGTEVRFHQCRLAD